MRLQFKVCKPASFSVTLPQTKTNVGIPINVTDSMPYSAPIYNISTERSIKTVTNAA